jgi:fatty acid omega-hydroxylase
MTTPETAWTEAMKYENRANPYPFFDELRKTPVVRVADNTYVVTGYRELLTLAHDPTSAPTSHRVPSRPNRPPMLRPTPVQNTCRPTAGNRAS